MKGREFRLPRGLVQGQKLTQILRGLTVPVAQIQDFDDLAIPFRAIATDIVTGDRVVIDHGDLTTAMRASLSAPGVFAPVDFEGRMLVDGGLTSNLPIDVAREMGVDVLIVVDCGFPLLERNKLDSVATVSNQMLAILIRQNTTAQRKSLTDRDVVIDPALGDFSSLDFTEHAKAMKIGEEAARGAVERLAALGVTDPEFARIVGARSTVRNAPPKVEFLRVEPGSERYTDAIDALFGDQVGRNADATELGKRVNALYGQGNLEIFDYRVVPAEARRRSRRRTLRPGAHHSAQFLGSELPALRPAVAERLRGQFLVQRRRARHAGRDHALRRRMGVGPADRRDAARVHRGLPAVRISFSVVRGAARRFRDPHVSDRR